ncbi:MAG: DUF3883 domain-containing protein [Deltaproteobacteria bacterium]|jgi:hypothetical protein|nr:DUF3883 domain-containing protein [Deltaproteobacteria bacterium]
MSKPETFAADEKARRTIELSTIEALMDIETSLGFISTNVSTAKVGYDVVSFIPANPRSVDCEPLRFTEVKGRAQGEDTVTISKNEILTAFNKPDTLAIVEMDGEATNTVYLKKPFHERPDFATTSVNYNIVERVNGSKLLLTRAGLCGGLDGPAQQERIVNIMEGGKEAFEKRKEIYQIWKP